MLTFFSCKPQILTFASFFFFSEALPFFLLLIDLSRASALAKFALSSNSQVRGDIFEDFLVGWCFTLGFLFACFAVEIFNLMFKIECCPMAGHQNLCDL